MNDDIEELGATLQAAAENTIGVNLRINQDNAMQDIYDAQDELYEEEDDVNEMLVQIENLKVQIAMNGDKTEKERMGQAKEKIEARVKEG